MKTIIETVASASRAEWASIWEDCEYATYFHSPEWAEVWAEYSQGRVRPTPQLVTFVDGKRALLPLCYETRLGGLLSRYVSSPEGTFGGWLAREPLNTEHAVALIDWMTKQQGHSLVWRLNPDDPLVFEAGQIIGLDCKSDETHALELGPGMDALFKALKPSYRSDIRKALAKGAISIAPATTREDWQAYYGVYQDSRQRWGQAEGDGYGWPLFEALFELHSPHVTLWLARSEGQVVSGDVCFYARKHVVYWHGATLKEHLSSNVAKLMKYHVIKDACERGFAWYDFNPSAGLSGVKFFKEAFKARALPAPMVYVDTALKRLARVCAARLHVQHAQPALEPLEALASRLPAAALPQPAQIPPSRRTAEHHATAP